MNSITNTNKKRVKFKKNITVIDVECWKEYNLEQVAEENFDNIVEDIGDIEMKDETEIDIFTKKFGKS